MECACGCGETIEPTDKYGRPHKFISGHNTEKKYEDPTQYKREYNHRNRRKRFLYKTKWSHKLRGELLKIKGGKCTECGFEYNGENAPCFDFHHNDPKTKKFNIGLVALTRYGRKTIDEELEKCRVICSNCHRLIGSEKY